MRKYILLSLLLSLVLLQSAFAAGTRYEMVVDGLACPYCAYGIEKKLKQIDGLETFKMDLDKGVVTVEVSEGTVLTDEQMQKLFHDAGFTYRSMIQTPL